MRVTKPKIEYIIRPLEEKDIPQVLEVDHEAFPSQWPYPTYSSFKQELRNRLAHYIVVSKPNEDLSQIQASCPQENPDNKNFFNRLLDLKHLFDFSQKSANALPPPSTDIIMGMAGFWLMVGEAHIITIAVRKAYRRNGIGERMLISIVEKAIELNANMVTLEVRVSNSEAQELYKKYGFNPTGIRRKYYTDNGENALIMSIENIVHPSYCLRFQHLKEAHEDRWGN